MYYNIHTHVKYKSEDTLYSLYHDQFSKSVYLKCEF